MVGLCGFRLGRWDAVGGEVGSGGVGELVGDCGFEPEQFVGVVHGDAEKRSNKDEYDGEGGEYGFVDLSAGGCEEGDEEEDESGEEGDDGHAVDDCFLECQLVEFFFEVFHEDEGVRGF